MGGAGVRVHALEGRGAHGADARGEGRVAVQMREAVVRVWVWVRGGVEVGRVRVRARGVVRVVQWGGRVQRVPMPVRAMVGEGPGEVVHMGGDGERVVRVDGGRVLVRRVVRVRVGAARGVGPVVLVRGVRAALLAGVVRAAAVDVVGVLGVEVVLELLRLVQVELLLGLRGRARQRGCGGARGTEARKRETNESKEGRRKGRKKERGRGQ